MAKESKTNNITSSVKPQKPNEKDDFLTEYVEVTLFKDSDKYKSDLLVGVNGYTWQIKRGYPVRIPRYVYHVIQESHRQELLISNRQDDLQNDFEDMIKKGIN